MLKSDVIAELSVNAFRTKLKEVLETIHFEKCEFKSIEFATSKFGNNDTMFAAVVLYEKINGQ
jgi:hypothetical protein